MATQVPSRRPPTSARSTPCDHRLLRFREQGLRFAWCGDCKKKTRHPTSADPKSPRLVNGGVFCTMLKLSIRRDSDLSASSRIGWGTRRRGRRPGRSVLAPEPWRLVVHPRPWHCYVHKFPCAPLSRIFLKPFFFEIRCSSGWSADPSIRWLIPLVR